MPRQLAEEPEVPAALEHVVDWFWDLSESRDYDESGPKRISYRELQAWQAMTGIDATAWEIAMLRRLDRIYREQAAKSKS